MAYGLTTEDKFVEENPMLRSLRPPDVRSPFKINLSNEGEKPKTSTKAETFLRQVQGWCRESDELSSRHQQRWAKNIRLVRGIWGQGETTRSKVRNRSKIFFRKIWSSNQRLAASMHQAFLKEQDQFRILPRMGNDGDDLKAAILQLMTEYRRDVMMRKRSLYIKLLWGIMDTLDLGLGCAKMRWIYNEETGEDEPDLVPYPPEQVKLDLSKSTKDQMRYVIFEDYVTLEDLEDEGYEGLEHLGKGGAVPNNVVRSARYFDNVDPASTALPSNANAYPSPGKGEDERSVHPASGKFIKREVFYREKGKIKFGVTVGDYVLREPEDSPYGKCIPLLLGNVLTVSHQLIGEGFPEPLEGPQESLNVNLNQRKDNLAVLINGEHVVGRYSNVDLHALSISRPANIILSDDPNAVKSLEKKDYTQSAYMEAAQDEGMIAEMSAVTPGKLGMDRASKATTSQINFNESNAKIDLFITTLAETYFRDFFSLLAYFIQLFETDETVFRIANDSLHKKMKMQPGQMLPFVDNLEFEADCIIQVGAGTVSQEVETRNLMLAMDRANMSNQAMAQIAQLGMIPPEGLEIFSIPEFMRVILPKLGQKNVDKFFVKVPPPPPAAPEGGGAPQDPDVAGLLQAQGEEPMVEEISMEQELEGALP